MSDITRSGLAAANLVADLVTSHDWEPLICTTTTDDGWTERDHATAVELAAAVLSMVSTPAPANDDFSIALTMSDQRDGLHLMVLLTTGAVAYRFDGTGTERTDQ